MKIPFLKQLQRLMGPVANQVEVPAGPAGGPAEQAMRHLLAELPDLLMAAVVEVATSEPLATYTTDRNLRPSGVVGFDAEVVRQVQTSLKGLGTNSERLEEILLTLPTQLHLVHLSDSGQLFIYLAVETSDTNLGIARTVMRGAIALVEPATTIE